MLFRRLSRVEPFLCSGGFADPDGAAFAAGWPAEVLMEFWLVLVGLFKPAGPTEET